MPNGLRQLEVFNDVRLVLLPVLIALAGCTTIDTAQGPPADWPALDQRVYLVPHGRMAQVCGAFLPAYMTPRACAVVDFGAGICTVVLSQELSSRGVEAHERKHCLGYDHPGESVMRDAWAQWKRVRDLRADYSQAR